MMFLVGIWVLTAVTSIALWSFVEIGAKKKNEETLSVLDIFLLLVGSFVPLVQFVLFGIVLHGTLKIVAANREEQNEVVEAFCKKMNTLFECEECGLIQRRYQLQADNYTHCCGDDSRCTLNQVYDCDIYQYALETGLTPEMDRKTAVSIIENEQEVKKLQQEKAKKEKETKEQMQHLLRKTKYIQQQNDIYLKKEQEKLDKMNAEKEQRIEEVLQVLQGEQKEEFVKTIELFDALHAVELKKLEEFKKTNEEKISSLQQKLNA